MRRALLVVAACGGGTTTTPPSNAGGTTPTRPDLAGVQTAVAPHAALPLTNDRGCTPDQTLGEYVPMLVKNGTGEPGSTDTHRLTGGCAEFPAADSLAPIAPPSDPAYWYCRIDSYTSDPEAGCGRDCAGE